MKDLPHLPQGHTRREMEISRRRFAIAFGVILSVAGASLAGVVIVAWHFISKVW